jgi:hypothetical protein
LFLVRVIWPYQKSAGNHRFFKRYRSMGDIKIIRRNSMRKTLLTVAAAVALGTATMTTGAMAHGHGMHMGSMHMGHGMGMGPHFAARGGHYGGHFGRGRFYGGLGLGLGLGGLYAFAGNGNPYCYDPYYYGYNSCYYYGW